MFRVHLGLSFSTNWNISPRPKYTNVFISSHKTHWTLFRLLTLFVYGKIVQQGIRMLSQWKSFIIIVNHTRYSSKRFISISKVMFSLRLNFNFQLYQLWFIFSCTKTKTCQHNGRCFKFIIYISFALKCHFTAYASCEITQYQSVHWRSNFSTFVHNNGIGCINVISCIHIKYSLGGLVRATIAQVCVLFLFDAYWAISLL